MLELSFLRPLVRWLGIGWKCSWTSQRDSYPAIEYHCPACGKSDAWVSGINGFNGVAPVPHCCANASPFPMNDESCVVHLFAKPRFSDGKMPVQPFIDTDEGGATGETGYVRGNPAVMTR
jgi:hypothetical protein